MRHFPLHGGVGEDDDGDAPILGVLGGFALQGNGVGVAGHALDLAGLQAGGLEHAPGGVGALGAQLPVGVGLGGILDVVDSLLGAAPISYAWWVSGLLVATA